MKHLALKILETKLGRTEKNEEIYIVTFQDLIMTKNDLCEILKQINEENELIAKIE